MDEVPNPGMDDERRLFKQFAAQHGEPAFARRARHVQEGLEILLERCGKRREELIAMVRLHLGTLHALAGQWGALRPLLADEEQVRLLQGLHDELTPTLRIPVEPTSSPRKLRRALIDLRDSLDRFNQAWQDFLRQVDVGRVNQLRDGYNRWYLLEKECALRSPRLARMGFRPLEPLTLDELGSSLPPLPVPRLAP